LWGLRWAAISYVGLGVVLPLLVLLKDGLSGGLSGFWAEIVNPTALAALELTLSVAIVTTLLNCCLGTLTAYVLVRYDFPGRELFNAAVDLPSAIPTLVIGVMLVVLYGPQAPIGAWLAARGIQVIFATPGILLAMLLVTYPFVIRAVQPVLIEMELDQEEAAYTLGARPWTVFWRILLPGLGPAISTGAMLSFARALGEFGAVVVVAGNIPGRTLTAPVHIFGLIEAQDTRGASALSTVLVAVSFLALFGVERAERRREARNAGV
jgi:sulfate/thiosulfate transport system permease protein